MTGATVDAVQRLTTGDQLGIAGWTLQGRIQPLATVLTCLTSRRGVRPDLRCHAGQNYRKECEGAHAADYTRTRSQSRRCRRLELLPALVRQTNKDEVPMDIWQDIRFAARLLIKDRWFTLTAATALALGHLGIGLLIGVAGALGVGQLLRSLLVQTSPTDPTTLVSIVALLMSVAVLACLWPARRAARLDPMVALRYE